MNSRDQALLAARLAAYGSADVRTPADYTWQEALDAYGREQVATQRKKRKWESEEKEEE